MSILTGRVWPLDPHQVPHCLHVGRDGIPLCCDSLWEDTEVHAVDCHCAVVEHIVSAQSAGCCSCWLTLPSTRLLTLVAACASTATSTAAHLLFPCSCGADLPALT
jgi:hypothetical protein